MKTYEPVEPIPVIPPKPSPESAIHSAPRLKRAISLNSGNSGGLKVQEPEPMIGRQNFMSRRFSSKHGLEGRRNFGSTQV